MCSFAARHAPHAHATAPLNTPSPHCRLSLCPPPAHPLPDMPPFAHTADAREEEARRDAQFDYYPSSCQALGFGYRPLDVVGEVPDPFYVVPSPPGQPPLVRPSPAHSHAPAVASTPSPSSTPAAQAAAPSAAAAVAAPVPPFPAAAPLPTAASPAPPPPPPQPQQLETAPERLRRHLLDVQPSVVYLQVAVAAAVAALLLWQRGKRRPGSPWLSPRGGLTKQPSLPLHSVRSPRASPVKSPR